VSFSLAIVFPIILPVLPRPGYPFNKHSEAVAACAGIGARLATRAELDYAFFQVEHNTACPARKAQICATLCARGDRAMEGGRFCNALLNWAKSVHSRVLASFISSSFSLVSS
jgi:hypothetical protein